MAALYYSIRYASWDKKGGCPGLRFPGATEYAAAAVWRSLRGCGGQLTAYDSPDNPTSNHDFYAVMTNAAAADLVLLVCDTDEYPGAVGTELHGLYWVEGATLVSVAEQQ